VNDCEATQRAKRTLLGQRETRRGGSPAELVIDRRAKGEHRRAGMSLDALECLTDKANHLCVKGRYTRAANRVRGTSILPAHTTQGLSAGPPAATLGSADRAGRPLVCQRASSGKWAPGQWNARDAACHDGVDPGRLVDSGRAECVSVLREQALALTLGCTYVGAWIP
jgi:hypothetical protein